MSSRGEKMKEVDQILKEKHISEKDAFVKVTNKKGGKKREEKQKKKWEDKKINSHDFINF